MSAGEIIERLRNDRSPAAKGIVKDLGKGQYDVVEASTKHSAMEKLSREWADSAKATKKKMIGLVGVAQKVAEIDDVPEVELFANLDRGADFALCEHLEGVLAKRKEEECNSLVTPMRASRVAAEKADKEWRSANQELVQSERDLNAKLAMLRSVIESGRALLAISGVKITRSRKKKTTHQVQPAPAVPTLTIVPPPAATPATAPAPAPSVPDITEPLANVG